jgi:hypothetical protein
MAQFVNVYNPKVNLTSSQESSHIIKKGGRTVTQQVLPADSFQTVPTSTLFTVYSPSPETIVDRNIRVKSYWKLTSQSGDFNLGLDDAVRQFGFSSTVATSSVTINGENISDNTADKIHALACYGNTAEQRGSQWSACGAMPDSYQKYSDYVTFGTARNPLAEYGEVSSEQSRGGLDYTVISPTVVEFSLTEFISISPLLNGLTEEEGFANIDRLNVSFRHKADLSRVWSHADTGNAISGLTVEFTKAPELLVTFITPDNLESIPEVQSLSYSKLQDYVIRTEAVASGASSQIALNSLKLTQIPEKMYIFVKLARDQETFETSDSFAGITRVSVLFDNQSGLLGNATQEDLYKMSVENGLNLTFPAFKKYRGSVICIDMGKDIGLPDGLAPRVNGNFSTQTTINFENLSSVTQTYEVWSILQYSGVIEISEHQSRTILGGISQADVLATTNGPSMSNADYQHLSGGSFWTSLKSVIKGAGRGVSALAPVASGVASALGRPDIGMGISTAGAVGKAISGSGLRSGGGMGMMPRRRVR